jgi:hypothetical protein
MIISIAWSKFSSCILWLGLWADCRRLTLFVAVGFYRPAGQQQAEDDTKNELFLFRQAFHLSNLTEKSACRNNVLIYDLRLTNYAADFISDLARKS